MMFLKFLADEAGATAIEYALIAGFLSIVIIPAVVILSGSLVATFETIASLL
jgi:pilus assembly protein Flp/PilA